MKYDLSLAGCCSDWSSALCACRCLARSARRGPPAPGSAASPAGIPRTADGKPDFTGTYQWPTYLPGDERGRSSATVFDRKRFAPLKPGGEAVPRAAHGRPPARRTARLLHAGGLSRAACCRPTRCSSSRRRTTS